MPHQCLRQDVRELRGLSGRVSTVPTCGSVVDNSRYQTTNCTYNRHYRYDYSYSVLRLLTISSS